MGFLYILILSIIDPFHKDIVFNDVYITIRNTRNDKAAGYDELPAEDMKKETAVNILARLFFLFKF